MKIELEIPDGKRAEWVDGVLTLVDDEPQDITKCVKTFADACEWCHLNGLDWLVEQFTDVSIKLNRDPRAKDIIAYLKLRIITAALNEGWEPKKIGHSEYVGVFEDSNGFITHYWNSNHSNAALKLCFEYSNLAEYAASQFRDIYADFCGGKKGGEK